MNEEVVAALTEYSRLAAEWGTKFGRDAKSANALLDRLAPAAETLRRSPAGRIAIESLFTHEATGVRFLAGFEGLAWGAEGAVQAVESVINDPGTLAVVAKYRLAEHQNSWPAAK